MTANLQLAARAERWLVEHPSAPLRDVAAVAVVVIARGDPDLPVSFDAISERTGIPKGEVVQALWSALEEQELYDEERRL